MTITLPPAALVHLRYGAQVKRTVGVSYDLVRQMGLALPHVEESTSHGTPALKAKGKLFVRLREDSESIVVKMPFDRREELLAADPDTYYITDHYRAYEWVLVRLAQLHPDALADLLRTAWRTATAKHPIPISRR